MVIEGGGWLVSLSRYIHYNPVAIQGLGMSKREKAAEGKGRHRPSKDVAARRLEVLRKYPWSSYPAYAGYIAAPAWLSTGEVLGRSRGGRNGYREETEARLRAGHDEDVWAALKWGFVLGREAFAESVRKQLKVTREHAGRMRLRRRLAWADLVRCMEEMKGEAWSSFCDRYGDWGRDVTLWAARRWGGYTLADLAREVGDLDYTAIYQGIRRLENRAGKDKILAEFRMKFVKKLEALYNV